MKTKSRKDYSSPVWMYRVLLTKSKQKMEKYKRWE